MTILEQILKWEEELELTGVITEEVYGLVGYRMSEASPKLRNFLESNKIVDTRKLLNKEDHQSEDDFILTEGYDGYVLMWISENELRYAEKTKETIDKLTNKARETRTKDWINKNLKKELLQGLVEAIEYSELEYVTKFVDSFDAPENYDSLKYSELSELSNKWGNKIAHNGGDKVEFLSKDHLYILNDETQLKSVTTLLKEYFPKFNSELVAERYAKKHNMSIEEVMLDWEEKRVTACDFGTLFHSWAELLLEEDDYEINTFNEKEENYLATLRDFIPSLKERYEIIAIEKLLFDADTGIAGTPDIIARSLEDGFLYILDWKTNKSIDLDNIWEKGFGVMEGVPNSNYYHYSFQLNLYASLLRKNYGYNEPIKGRILHVKNNKIEEIDVADGFLEISDKLLK